MSFGDLGKKPLAQFVVDDRFTDELCVFIHIPKTAGSSFSAELDRLRPPYHNIHRRYFGEETVTFSSIEEEMETLVAGGELREAKSCSGHFSFEQARPIMEQRPDARFVTFLRDPVKRVISDYRYARTPTHPTYKSFIARFPDIESYVATHESQNKMSRFLLPTGMKARADIEAHLDSKFAFIGLLEMYPISFNILSRLLGDDKMPSEYKRKTEKTADNDVAETPELIKMIAEHNPRDKLIYDFVRRRLVGVRDDWKALRGGKQAA